MSEPRRYYLASYAGQSGKDSEITLDFREGTPLLFAVRIFFGMLCGCRIKIRGVTLSARITE